MEAILERIKRARECSAGMVAPEYECDICKDALFLFKKNEDGYEVAIPCKCRELRNAKARMKASGISEEDLKKGFGDFLTHDEKPLMVAKQISIKYFKDFENIKDSRVNSILLCGAAGRGKTTLGLAITNNLLASGVPVLYMPYRDTVTELKQNIIDEVAYKERMYKLKNVSVLFLDDMFKGKITESDINIMYEIINHRYLQRLPLIISTEKTQEELLEIDEAIGSRLIEMSKTYIVTFDKSVPNYRLR